MEINSNVERILETVSQHKQITRDDIVRKSKRRPLPYSRKLAIYFLRHEPGTTCEAIAKLFGWAREHRMVSEYYSDILIMKRIDKRVNADIQQIKMKLEANG